MFAVLSDTHSETDHQLRGRAREAVREADAVVHCGDFTTESVLDAFHDASARLHAVHGNADTPAVRERLPEARTVEVAGVRVAATHRSRSGPTGLRLFGRQRDADLVVSGHTHRPSVEVTDGVVLLNPGSHADPRGNPAAHAEFERDGDAVCGRIRDRSGDVLETVRVEGRR